MIFSLRIKLIGSFIIILLLMIIVGLVGIYSSIHIRNHLKNTEERDVKAANIMGVVARRVGFINSNSLLHLLSQSVDDMNRYESEIADWESKVIVDLDSLEIIFRDRGILDKLLEFRASFETYLRIWREQVLPLSLAGHDEEAFDLARKKGLAGMVAIEAMYKLNELHDANVAAAICNLEMAKQDFNKSQVILMLVIFIAIILGLGFGIKQSSLISGAVNTISKAAQKVAAGELDQRVTIKTGDEIESMANSFNTMTGNMKKTVEELRHEITERERSEQALIRSNDKLAAVNKELETFSYSVSHDLRTPLRAIDGFSKAMLEDYSNAMDEQQQHYLQRMRVAAQNMSQLIDDLLDLSRIGRRLMNKKTINIETIAREAYKLLEDEWKNRKVNFTVHQCPTVFADFHLMKIVFANLLSNALKFTRNRATAEIEVDCEIKDEQTIIFVKDNGIGFDMKYADKIFSTFQRLHHTEKYEGTGIGLATVQRIINRHGGQIRVQSKPDLGTTFYFNI